MESARIISEWAKKRKLRSWWGSGKDNGSYFPTLDYQGGTTRIFSLWTYGEVEVQFQYLKNAPPFDSEELRVELCRRLNAVPGVRIPSDAIYRRPSFPLTVLADRSALDDFLAAFEWAIGRIMDTAAEGQ